MKTSTEIFIITNEDGSKTITDVAWRGLSLEPQKMEDILFGLRITENEKFFERKECDNSSIQYYQNFNNAEKAITAIRAYSNPITSTLKIVCFKVFIETEETVYVNAKHSDENFKKMLEFEKDTRVITNDDNLDYSKYRSADNSHYENEIVQRSFQGWKAYRNK